MVPSRIREALGGGFHPPVGMNQFVLGRGCHVQIIED